LVTYILGFDIVEDLMLGISLSGIASSPRFIGVPRNDQRKCH